MCAGARPGRSAQTVGASRASGYRWWARYQAEGWPGVGERPSTRQPRPSARCCGGRALRSRRSCATSAPSPASSRTWTRKSWTASDTSASASAGMAGGAVHEPGGNTCTWRTTRGFRTVVLSRLSTALAGGRGVRPARYGESSHVALFGRRGMGRAIWRATMPADFNECVV